MREHASLGRSVKLKLSVSVVSLLVVPSVVSVLIRLWRRGSRAPDSSIAGVLPSVSSHGSASSFIAGGATRGKRVVRELERFWSFWGMAALELAESCDVLNGGWQESVCLMTMQDAANSWSNAEERWGVRRTHSENVHGLFGDCPASFDRLEDLNASSGGVADGSDDATSAKCSFTRRCSRSLYLLGAGAVRAPIALVDRLCGEQPRLLNLPVLVMGVKNSCVSFLLSVASRLNLVTPHEQGWTGSEAEEGDDRTLKPVLLSATSVMQELSAIFSSLVPTPGRSPTVVVLRLTAAEESGVDMEAYADDLWSQLQLDSSSTDDDLFDIVCISQHTSSTPPGTGQLSIEIYPSRTFYLSQYLALMLQAKNNAIMSMCMDTDVCSLDSPVADPQPGIAAVEFPLSPRFHLPSSPMKIFSPAVSSPRRTTSSCAAKFRTTVFYNLSSASGDILMETMMKDTGVRPPSPITAEAEGADYAVPDAVEKEKWVTYYQSQRTKKAQDAADRLLRNMRKEMNATVRAFWVAQQENQAATLSHGDGTDIKSGLYPNVVKVWRFLADLGVNDREEMRDRVLEMMKGHAFSVCVIDLPDNRIYQFIPRAVPRFAVAHSRSFPLSRTAAEDAHQQHLFLLHSISLQREFTPISSHSGLKSLFRLARSIMQRLSPTYSEMAQGGGREKAGGDRDQEQELMGNAQSTESLNENFLCFSGRSATRRRFSTDVEKDWVVGPTMMNEEAPFSNKARPVSPPVIHVENRLKASLGDVAVSRVMQLDSDQSLSVPGSVFSFILPTGDGETNPNTEPHTCDAAASLSMKAEEQPSPLGTTYASIGSPTKASPPTPVCSQHSVSVTNMFHCGESSAQEMTPPSHTERTNSQIFPCRELEVRLQGNFCFLSFLRNVNLLVTLFSKLSRENFFENDKAMFYTFSDASATLFNASMRKMHLKEPWTADDLNNSSNNYNYTTNSNTHPIDQAHNEGVGKGLSSGALWASGVGLPGVMKVSSCASVEGQDKLPLRSNSPASSYSILHEAQEEKDWKLSKIREVCNQRNRLLYGVNRYLHCRFFEAAMRPAQRAVKMPPLGRGAVRASPPPPLSCLDNAASTHSCGASPHQDCCGSPPPQTNESAAQSSSCFFSRFNSRVYFFGGVSVPCDSVTTENGHFGLTPLDVWMASRYSQRIAAEVYIMDVSSVRGDPYIPAVRVIDEVVAHAVLLYHDRSLYEFLLDLQTHFDLKYTPKTSWGRHQLSALPWLQQRAEDPMDNTDMMSLGSRDEDGFDQLDGENVWDAEIKDFATSHLDNTETTCLLEEMEHVKLFLIHHRHLLSSAMLTPAKANRLECIFGVPSTVFPFLLCQRESIPLIHTIYDNLVQHYGELTYQHFYSFMNDAFSSDRPEVVKHTPRIFRTLNRSRTGCISFEELCGWLARKLSCGSQKRPDAHLLAVLMSLRLPLALVIDQKAHWLQREFAFRSVSDGEEDFF